jgi:outer membrane protein assembly factor BamB
MNSVRSTVITISVWAMLLLPPLAGWVRGDDWPQWRGPARDGISRETGLLKEWPPEGPKLLWQAKDLGQGYSTPAVVGERLYLISNKGVADEFVEARNVADGKQAWSTRIGKVGNPDQGPSYPAARSTPTVDGEWLYALGSDGDLACLEVATGKPRWQKNVRSEFGGKPGEWAYSESPLIDGEVLVCTPGGADATIVALNKQNGDVIWKSAVPGGDAAGYASPIAVDAGGVKQYVQFLGKGLVGVDAKTGAFLWRYDRTAKGSPANIPTPVARDSQVYSAAHRTGGALIKLVSSEGKLEPQQIYFDNKLPSAIGGSVLVGDHLYGTTGPVLVCADFNTGQVKWTDRSIGTGSVCYADGLLYLHGENGDVALVEATPEGYRERGRFTPVDQPDRGKSKAWTYPVVSNGRLYVRDTNSLWSYDIKSTSIPR